MVRHVIVPIELLEEMGIHPDAILRSSERAALLMKVFDQDEVLNLKEAAAFLKVSEEAVLQMIREQQLPARQIGMEWRLLKAGSSRIETRAAASAHCVFRCSVGATTTMRSTIRRRKSSVARRRANVVLPAPGVAAARKSRGPPPGPSGPSSEK